MASSPEVGSALRGRRSECNALSRLVAGARAGQSGVLVVRGEAGVGKTALLDYLVRHASGCRVARAVGVESEMELPYAGLHQLCAHVLGHVGHLPGPQREALATAFGLSTGEPPDRFMVGLAALSLLSEVAESEPLVCVVDDAQWLDRVSAQTLAFVARRLLAERIVLVFAVRDPTGERDLAGLPELALSGLSHRDARALLDSVIPGPVDEQVRERIIAETRGNPLTLLELPRGLTPSELAFGFGLTQTMPLANRIEQGFLRRLEELPTRYATGPARGGRRTQRRRRSAAQGCRAARDRRRGSSGGRGDWVDRTNAASPVPPPPGALSGVLVCVAARTSGRPPCPG
jgi:hypothetical protein